MSCLSGSCAESSLVNLTSELDDFAAAIPASHPLYVGIYFSSYNHCETPSSTYDAESLSQSLDYPGVSGAMVYTMQRPGAEATGEPVDQYCAASEHRDDKGCVVRRLFGAKFE